MGSIIRTVGKIFVSGVYLMFRVTVGMLKLILLIFVAVMNIVLSFIKMGEQN